MLLFFKKKLICKGEKLERSQKKTARITQRLRKKFLFENIQRNGSGLFIKRKKMRGNIINIGALP